MILENSLESAKEAIDLLGPPAQITHVQFLGTGKQVAVTRKNHIWFVGDEIPGHYGQEVWPSC